VHLDPVFFLHHTNLDRLWWQWQNTAQGGRVNAYQGKANNNTDIRATLMDVLDVGGLSRSLQVADVMETTQGLFCYTY
jgi:tyrosinase